MRILLTGSSGMVGKNISENANSKQYVLLTPSSADLDLMNKNNTIEYLNENKPDMIIHCAGRVGGIQANISNPVNFLVDNLQMGLNLIMGSSMTGVKKFINMGSSCMYPKDALNPLGEELLLKGELEPTNEGYALAKVTLAKLCEYISKKNDEFHYKTVIPCNLYGKYDKFGDNHSHMLPAVIKKIHAAKMNNQEKIDIWGDGNARREFMYAEDLADFVYYALDNFDKMPQNINVGLGYDCTINEYYQIVKKVVGYKGKFTHDLARPVGMKQKLIDDTKLKKFGWKHKTSINDGIRKLYNYYLNEEL